MILSLRFLSVVGLSASIPSLPTPNSPMAAGCTSTAPQLQGVQDVSAPLPHVFWGDFDGDGFQDIYAVNPSGEDRLLRNGGDGHFDDVTERAGVGGVSGTVNVGWADYDRDGNRDLYVSSSRGPGRLFRNRGNGTFENATWSAGIRHVEREQGVAWFDFDSDELPDLEVATRSGDLLYHNVGAGTLERVALPIPVQDLGARDGAPGVGETPLANNGPDLSLPDSSRNPGIGRGGTPAERLPRNGPRDRVDDTGASRSSLTGPGVAVQPFGGHARGTTPTNCFDGITDQSGGPCITASRAPGTEGMLYPLSDKLFVTSDGRVGIGTTTPADYQRLHVNNGQLLVSDNHSNGQTGVAIIGNYNSTGHAAIASTSIDEPRGPLSFVTGDTENMTIDTSGRVGIGTTTPADELQIVRAGTARISVHNTNTAPGQFTDLSLGTGNVDSTGVLAHVRATVQTSSPLRSSLAFVVNAGNSALQGMTIRETGNVGIGTPSPSEALDVNGKTKTKCVTITGGCDIVEGFETGGETYEPGTVLVIDPLHPGQLRQSTAAYDKKIAGVVSGAGGVQAGVQLSQEGVLDGDTKVAMAGRVYVICSAENGAIEPGDRLTTAATPGHGMKATDPALCDGAVVGKAMTSLARGHGLVLVLVNLQ